MNLRTLLFFIFFLCAMGLVHGQEICDNGIDDDGDGLVDLNDEDDCICSSLLPSSLIPNPSFEERTCCPTGNAQLSCAVGWIQASGPTTDYINTCGNYLGNPNANATAPLPLPDGMGAVGFRDGEQGPGSDFKEYVGACLTETMLAGVAYRLEFFVGFQNNKPGSMNIDIGIYASPDCTQLPFGNGGFNDGCPTKWPTYELLDLQSVSGSNEWVKVVFEFTPVTDLNVMVIGPGCDANPQINLSPYFYVDGLTLAESAKFGVPLEDVEGSICNDDLVLSIESEDALGFQWYKDGVALVGETMKELSLITQPEVAGTYLVVIYFEEDCISSKTYEVRIPPYYFDISPVICEGEEFSIETESWDTPGNYEITISAKDGCDSIITVFLDVTPTTYETIEDIYCEGDTYTLLDITAGQEGSYETTITNVGGCDSIITLILTEIPETSGIELPQEITVDLGDYIDITPDEYDPLLIDFEWFQSDGTLVGEELTLSNLQPLDTETFIIIGKDQFGCDAEDMIILRVDKSNTTIYTPNIFSPDNNRINDFFNFQGSQSLVSVEYFMIFDRWGNKLFEEKNIVDFENFEGWNGEFNGQQAEQGVYGWMAKASFLDGSEKNLSGDLTLVRF